LEGALKNIIPEKRPAEYRGCPCPPGIAQAIDLLVDDRITLLHLSVVSVADNDVASSIADWINRSKAALLKGMVFFRFYYHILLPDFRHF
jgi:hypothetical protein